MRWRKVHKRNENVKERLKNVKDDLQPATSGPVCILAAPWTLVINVEKDKSERFFENHMQPVHFQDEA